MHTREKMRILFPYFSSLPIPRVIMGIAHSDALPRNDGSDAPASNLRVNFKKKMFCFNAGALEQVAICEFLNVK